MTLAKRRPVPSAYWPYPFLQNDQRRLALWQARQDSTRTPEDIYISEGEAAGLLAFLPWDSEFFGRAFFRLDYLFGNTPEARDKVLQSLERQAAAQGAKYLFGFIPAEETQTLGTLHQAQWKPIEARVCYGRRALGEFKPSKRFSVRRARCDEAEALGRVAIEAVNPLDRFQADPFFQKPEVDRLFAEWMKASLCNGFADAVLVPDVATPQAFMTLNYLGQEWEAAGMAISQIVLIGVHPDVTGWFPKLAMESLLHLREQGAQAVTLTTQTGNHAVIRTCEHLGFFRSHETTVMRKVLA